MVNNFLAVHRTLFIQRILISYDIQIFESCLIFKYDFDIWISSNIWIRFQYLNLVWYSNTISIFESRTIFEYKETIFKYPILLNLQMDIWIYYIRMEALVSFTNCAFPMKKFHQKTYILIFCMLSVWLSAQKTCQNMNETF